MKLYEEPKDYAGEHYHDYYVSFSRHRDSNVLDESNFFSALAAFNVTYDDAPDGLATEGTPHPLIVARAHHFLVGWVEVIYIHKSAAALVEIGETLDSRVEDYPVIDEDDMCSREHERADDYWKGCGLSERIELCTDAGLSMFSARSDSMPYKSSGEMLVDCFD